MKKIKKESIVKPKSSLDNTTFVPTRIKDAQPEPIDTLYTSQSEILETLSELSVGIDTYEFLGELFFEFLANEVRTTSPSAERLNLYINTRHQIHQLYELARAAKALRMKTAGNKV